MNTSSDHTKLGLAQQIRRNFGVWTEGLSIGLPPFIIMSVWDQFKKINGRRSTSYDQRMRFNVTSAPNSGLRISGLLVAVITLPLAALSFLGTQGQSPDTFSQQLVSTGDTADVAGADDRPSDVTRVNKVASDEVAAKGIDETTVVATNFNREPEPEPGPEPILEPIQESIAEPLAEPIQASQGLQTSAIDNSDTTALLDSPQETETLTPTPTVSSPLVIQGSSEKIFWNNPLSDLTTEISAQFEILQTQENADQLAIFKHRLSDTIVEFEKIDVRTALQNSEIPEFVAQAFDSLEINGTWIDFEMAGLQILETSGIDNEQDLPVSIQVTLQESGGSKHILILMMKGKSYKENPAEFDRLRATIWSSV